MSTIDSATRRASTVSLTDEEGVKKVLLSSVLGLWDVVCTHLNDEDGIGVLTSVVNKVARIKVFLFGDSGQGGEIAGSYPAKQIRILDTSALFIKDYPLNFIWSTRVAKRRFAFARDPFLSLGLNWLNQQRHRHRFDHIPNGVRSSTYYREMMRHLPSSKECQFHWSTRRGTLSALRSRTNSGSWRTILRKDVYFFILNRRG